MRKLIETRVSLFPSLALYAFNDEIEYPGSHLGVFQQHSPLTVGTVWCPLLPIFTPLDFVSDLLSCLSPHPRSGPASERARFPASLLCACASPVAGRSINQSWIIYLSPRRVCCFCPSLPSGPQNGMALAGWSPWDPHVIKYEAAGREPGLKSSASQQAVGRTNLCAAQPSLDTALGAVSRW